MNIQDEMEVLLDVAASAIRNLIAVIEGDDLGSTVFSREELDEIALTLGRQFLEDYEALYRRLEGQE